MDFRGKKYERGSNWSDPEVVELLQLWADDSVQIELESCLRNQHVFNRIAEVLREKGILRTGDQCREKIKKMKLDYRRIKENQKTVRGGRTWKFYDVMDRVLTNRPSVSYSSLGGTVISHQVLQGAPSSDAFLLHNIPAAAFSSASSGSLLFGHPPKPGDLLEIKREDVDSDDGLLNSDPQPPELLYQIGPGDEPDADSKSLGLEQEDLTEMGRGEVAANARFSPSGDSEQNMASSSGTGGSTVATPAAGPGVGEDGERAEGRECQGLRGPSPLWRRKRRRVGGGAGGRAALDAALVRFLSWQRVAEERLIALEEARMERELEAEERRESREQRRAEQDRQHELRLFTAFASALSARSEAPPPTCPAPNPASNPAPPAATADLECAERSPVTSAYLSSRGNRMRQNDGILQEGFAMYRADQHDFHSNRSGIVNLGTSENKLCYDLLSKRLTQADMLHMEPALLEYPDWRGHHFLRKEVASFLTEHCKSPSPLKVENVVVMNGCTSLLSCVAAVICDPGDAILVPTPFYGVIKQDVLLYSGVQLVHTHLDCQPSGSEDRPFQLTVRKLEQAMEQARKEGVRVRAMILVNPHNPLGEIYSALEMTAFLEFAQRHELHVIVDEVYLLSVFDESSSFQSVLSFGSLPDAQRTHMMWGMSKGFAAAGLRVGVLYSQNQEVLAALDQLGPFHGVASTAQHQVAQLFRDREWFNGEFLPQNLARMRAAHRYVSGELRSLGIPFLNRPAGFFIWADFREVLEEQSVQAERKLWRCFLRHKVLVSPGEAFSCTTPGWFRIIFTDPQERLQLGMQRLREGLEELGWVSGGPDAKPMAARQGAGQGDHAPGQENAAVEAMPKRDSPAPDSVSLVDEDSVTLERGSPAPASGSSLASLIGTLRQQIRSSDWLEKNTPEVSAGEDPELFDVFRDLLNRARK